MLPHLVLSGLAECRSMGQQASCRRRRTGWEMDAQIWISGASGDEIAALGEWLGDENELRGQVRAVRSSIGETDLGPVTEYSAICDRPEDTDKAKQRTLASYGRASPGE